MSEKIQLQRFYLNHNFSGDSTRITIIFQRSNVLDISFEVNGSDRVNLNWAYEKLHED